MPKAPPEPSVLEGKAGTRGIAVGTALVLGDDARHTFSDHRAAESPQMEIHRFEQSKRTAMQELEALMATASKLGGDEVKNIIHTQLEILNDPELNAELRRCITDEMTSASHAIEHVFRHYISQIEETGSDFMQERTADLRDLRDRIFRHLHFVSAPSHYGGNILVANEISPTELIEYAPFIKGAATMKGGQTSHITIIASSLNIPFVAGVKDLAKLVRTGDALIIDSDRRKVHVKPTAHILSQFHPGDIHPRFDAPDSETAQLPTSTACGWPITVKANVEFESELPLVEKCKPQGIGLVRTESMLLSIGADAPPDAQLKYYRSMADAAGTHSVTFRLLDIGGDKLTDRDESEANPHLGWRGARLLLDRPGLLVSQLDVILKVSSEYPGRVRLLLPMVTVLDEWLAFKDILAARMNHHDRMGLAYDGNLPVGMMIEVPSAAIIAGSLAKHADFLSIGTNDLTQYMLAVDRGNPLVADLYDSLHPSVLLAIQWVVNAAAEAGIPVTVCGEMAAQPIAAACLIGLGVTELSMSPWAIPEIRTMIRHFTKTEFEDLLKALMDSSTQADRKRVADHWRENMASRYLPSRD